VTQQTHYPTAHRYTLIHTHTQSRPTRPTLTVDTVTILNNQLKENVAYISSRLGSPASSSSSTSTSQPSTLTKANQPWVGIYAKIACLKNESEPGLDLHTPTGHVYTFSK